MLSSRYKVSHSKGVEMFIKVSVRQAHNNVVREQRFNARYITGYWQGTEEGTVMMSHDGTTYRVVIDINTLDAMLVG